MKKIIAAAVIASVLGIGGYFAYQQHLQTAFKESVIPHLKNASIRVTNSSALEVKPTNITFKEVFERLDADVTEIDKRLIEVQSLSSSKTAKLADPAIEYLRAAQEFSRALSMKDRKTLAVSNSMDSFKDAVSDMGTASRYSYEYAIKRADKAKADVSKAMDDSASAVKGLVKSATQLKAARDIAAAHFPEDALVANKQLDAVIAANADKPDEAKAPVKK